MPEFGHTELEKLENLTRSVCRILERLEKLEKKVEGLSNSSVFWEA